MNVVHSPIGVSLLSALIGLAACSADLGVRGLPDSWPDEPFTVEKWRAGNPENRYRLVRSLLRTQRLTGLTRAELERLLGPPDWPGCTTLCSYTVEGFRPAEKGRDPMAFTFLRSVNVCFDIHGRVATVSIGGD